ncbi:MAG: glutamine amidotransferase [Planctomycetaceae bacterium]|nr:glutamine amidotransferase [Planctomycetaceae bacterium]
MYIYFGDDDITRAAAYLCGIMYHYGIPFERVDSTQSPANALLQEPCDAFILSDYPHERFQPGQLETICTAVKNGAGLVMLGGWESYHGLCGEYHDTPLAEVLPVVMLDHDDRRNFSQGVLLCKEQDHPILDGLPWDCPPLVGGLNEFAAKSGARTLLIGKPLNICVTGETTDISSDGKIWPMLVVGEYGQGRTAALATDVAPHWVGGFVDWGNERITQKLPTGGSVEIGANYARFFARLVKWGGGS